MKPQYYILALLFVAFSLPQTLSAQTTQDQLIGSWTFDYDASLNSMNQKSKTHYNNMDTTRQSKITNAYLNRKITFNSDGAYVQVLSNGKTTNASWSIDGNNNLVITTPKGKSIQFKIKIHQSNINSLVLSQIKAKDNNLNILFPDWHLIKI